MAERLNPNPTIFDLRRVNEKLEKEIAERKLIERHLIQARDDSERANRSKSDFLSRISHELRTPLNAILGFSQLIAMDKRHGLAPSQENHVNQILRAGSHLMDMINELLDLARVESGKISLSIEDGELNGLVEEVLSLVLPLAQKQKIRICNRLDRAETYYVRADFTRLKQVLLNLLSNAIKFNCAEGTVTLHARYVERDRLEISVADQGQGIPDDRLRDLFEPFNRLNADVNGIEGTGIGLPISKGLVELMGGTLSVTSRLGEGSCFSVVLPRGIEIRNPRDTIQEQGLTVAGVETGVSNRKVLYVEDNRANMDLVKELFRLRPHTQLLCAPQANVGLDLARGHRPDLILMDLNLPGMDGMTALKHLKSSHETCDIPVIALSANGMKKDIDLALAKGFEGYIVKPIDVASFLNSVDKYLYGRVMPEGQCHDR
ncbi:MAG: hypothetical protein COV67_12560 [Nitrospinae bacterium CG11_big_fil_rev_8_21_14_0_20_56_8]|nr:MAG: hypothetical protein COV67_12560 [Nitrospinae bacterium CG11_big_fil_rev_8_21_14_0_20_56_8]